MFVGPVGLLWIHGKRSYNSKQLTLIKWKFASGAKLFHLQLETNYIIISSKLPRNHRPLKCTFPLIVITWAASSWWVGVGNRHFLGVTSGRQNQQHFKNTLNISVSKREAQVSSLCIQVKYNVWPKHFGPTCLLLFMSKHIINQHITCLLMKTLNTQNLPPPWITKVSESL